MPLGWGPIGWRAISDSVPYPASSAETLWTLNGDLLWDGTDLISCEYCPCDADPGVEVPCNADPVATLLTMTLTYDGHTIEIELTNVDPEESTACQGAEGSWEYVGPDVEFPDCEGMSLQANGAALCCFGETWHIAVSLVISGVGTVSFFTGGGFDTTTVEDESPMWLTTTTTAPFTSPCNLDPGADLDVDIQ